MNNGKTKATLQIVVAGYVIYLAVSLKDGIFNSTGGKQIFFIVAAIVMISLSLFIIVKGLKEIFKKEEDITDTNSQENTESENDK